MKSALLIIGASIVFLLPVAQPTVSQASLDVQPLQHEAHTLTVYQEQGGNRETIQLTTPNRIAPQPATVSVQGNQEDSDNLQPALGYGALNWTLQ